MNRCGFFSMSVVSNSEFWCLGVPSAEGMEGIKGTGELRFCLSCVLTGNIPTTAEGRSTREGALGLVSNIDVNNYDESKVDNF